MSSVAKTWLTPQEYLAKERLADFRSEFYRGEMFATSGAGWGHTHIKAPTIKAADQRSPQSPCSHRSRSLHSSPRVPLSPAVQNVLSPRK
jgi:hypothetical protein